MHYELLIDSQYEVLLKSILVKVLYKYKIKDIRNISVILGLALHFPKNNF